MRAIVFWFSLLILALGCSHTRHIRSTYTDEFRSLEQQASKKSCVVETVDGNKHKAEYLRLAEDSTSWVSTETGDIIRVPTRNIHEIVFVNRGRGMAEGAGLGLLIGATAGGLLGIALSSGSGGGEFDLGRDGGLIVGAVLVGVPSALIGAAIGAAVGSRDVYDCDTLVDLPHVFLRRSKSDCQRSGGPE